MDVFRNAFRHDAAAIFIAHNHPGGDLLPSPSDAAFTRKAVEAGKAAKVKVLHHIILGRSRFISMKELGLGFDDGKQKDEHQKPPERT